MRISYEKSCRAKRQLQVLPYLLACSTYEEAARQAHVSVKQIYCWLKTSAFKAELDKRRNEIIEEAVNKLKYNTTRAAKNTQMGIRRALKAGRYASGAAPIGYSWDRNGTHPMIKPNTDAGLVKEAFEIYATGLYSIEGVRKIVEEKGLNIQKTAFNRMLRNPIYKGHIVVPELGDEEEQELIGIHEAIISRELFDKVQTVLARILEKNALEWKRSTIGMSFL